MSESIIITKFVSKEDKYKQLYPQIEALVTGENDLIANSYSDLMLENIE